VQKSESLDSCGDEEPCSLGPKGLQQRKEKTPSARNSLISGPTQAQVGREVSSRGKFFQQIRRYIDCFLLLRKHDSTYSSKHL
jgi:hypothetical protein